MLFYILVCLCALRGWALAFAPAPLRRWALAAAPTALASPGATTIHGNSSSEVEIAPYLGLCTPLEDMVAGCDVENLGLQVLLGPSRVCDGLGLFVRINDETESSLQPRGTVICGYSRGTMVEEAAGPFTVAYAFLSAFNGVVFEKKVMPLFEAIGLASERVGASQLQDILEGHKIGWNAETRDILVTPLPEYPWRYFVPDPLDASDDGAPLWGPTNLGMYANDMGYSESVTEPEYEALAEKNVLRIVWRLELRDGKLAPSWPVVITTCDVRFTNREPMEVGLKYGWWYWKCAREESAAGAARHE